MKQNLWIFFVIGRVECTINLMGMAMYSIAYVQKDYVVSNLIDIWY